MEQTKPTGFTITRLAQVTPILRGLLATPTGNADLPYRPVLIESLTGEAALSLRLPPRNQGSGARPRWSNWRGRPLHGGGRYL